jgi:two-component system LytT family response regulator
MNLLIIEDEYPAAERLQKQLLRLDSSLQILAVLDSVEGAVAWLDQHPAPDLILSDIQLSDGLSFEIFDQVLVKSPIIFTTSYDEYAIKAFKVKSIDYLLKPIKSEELQRALTKYRELVPEPATEHPLRLEALLDSLPHTGRKHKSRFLVRNKEELVLVPEAEIAYFFSRHEQVCLVRKDSKRFTVDFTLEQLEHLLDPASFFRVNRQIIARLTAIQKIHPYFNGKLKLDLHPESPTEVTVSREKAGPLKEWLEG